MWRIGSPSYLRRKQNMTHQVKRTTDMNTNKKRSRGNTNNVSETSHMNKRYVAYI